MKKRFRLVISAVMILACLAFAGCSSSSSATTSSASAEASTEESAEESGTAGETAETSASTDEYGDVIKIGVLQIADSFPLYVAQEEGLFEKQGVNVEIIEFGSASDQSVAYEAGEIDGLMTDMIVQSLINKSSEDGMKAVAMALGGTAEEGRFLVVSSEKSGITEPAQLEGARIGISENTMMEYLVTAYLTDMGVDISKVELVNIPKLTLRLDSVIEGSDIQACIIPDPLAIEAVERGCNVVIDDTKLEKNYSQSVFTLRNNIIENYPETVEKYIAAIDEAIDMINADSEKYSELFAEKANVAAGLEGKYTVPAYTSNCIPTAEEVESIESWMVQKGLLDTAYTYEDIVYTEQ